MPIFSRPDQILTRPAYFALLRKAANLLRPGQPVDFIGADRARFPDGHEYFLLLLDFAPALKTEVRRRCPHSPIVTGSCELTEEGHLLLRAQNGKCPGRPIVRTFRAAGEPRTIIFPPGQAEDIEMEETQKGTAATPKIPSHFFRRYHQVLDRCTVERPFHFHAIRADATQSLALAQAGSLPEALALLDATENRLGPTRPAPALFALLRSHLERLRAFRKHFAKSGALSKPAQAEADRALAQASAHLEASESLQARQALDRADEILRPLDPEPGPDPEPEPPLHFSPFLRALHSFEITPLLDRLRTETPAPALAAKVQTLADEILLLAENPDSRLKIPEKLRQAHDLLPKPLPSRLRATLKNRADSLARSLATHRPPPPLADSLARWIAKARLLSENDLHPPAHLWLDLAEKAPLLLVRHAPLTKKAKTPEHKSLLSDSLAQASQKNFAAAHLALDTLETALQPPPTPEPETEPQLPPVSENPAEPATQPTSATPPANHPAHLQLLLRRAESLPAATPSDTIATLKTHFSQLRRLLSENPAHPEAPLLLLAIETLLPVPPATPSDPATHARLLQERHRALRRRLPELEATRPELAATLRPLLTQALTHTSRWQLAQAETLLTQAEEKFNS